MEVKDLVRLHRTANTQHSDLSIKKNSLSHIVQITDFLDFLHEYCEEKSETFAEF